MSSETAEGTRLLAYSVRRLTQAVPLVLVVLIINFFLIHAAPGDPVDMLLGGMDTDPEFQAQLRRELGLDQPLVVQLWTYVSNVARLDLGYSFRFRQDVGTLIMSRLPASLLLMGTSFVISVSFGILLGVLAAYRAGGLLERLLTGLTLSGYSMPVFWLGQLMLLVFAVGLGWFPIRHPVWPIAALQRRMGFSARLAGFCRGRCHQRRARRAEQASFSVLVSNRDFRVPRLRQRGGAGR